MVAVLKMIKAVVMVSTLSLISSFLLACRNDENVARPVDGGDEAVAMATVVKFVFADNFEDFVRSCVEKFDAVLDKASDISDTVKFNYKRTVQDYAALVQSEFTGRADGMYQRKKPKYPNTEWEGVVIRVLAAEFVDFVEEKLVTLKALLAKASATDVTERARFDEACKYAEKLLQELKTAQLSTAEWKDLNMLKKEKNVGWVILTAQTVSQDAAKPKHFVDVVVKAMDNIPAALQPVFTAIGECKNTHSWGDETHQWKPKPEDTWDHVKTKMAYGIELEMNRVNYIKSSAEFATLPLAAPETLVDPTDDPDHEDFAEQFL